MSGGFYLLHGDVDVLGISGKARSGKDWLAQRAAVESFGFLPMGLANHFKVSAIARGLEDLPPEDMDIEQMWETEKDDQHRSALQLEGTERGRAVHGEDIWCRHLEAWMYYFALRGFRKFVISDVRLTNEIEWIHSLGGKVYRITGRGGISNGLVGHSTETQLDDFEGFDRKIDNSPENERRAVLQTRLWIHKDFPHIPYLRGSR